MTHIEEVRRLDPVSFRTIHLTRKSTVDGSLGKLTSSVEFTLLSDANAAGASL